MSNELIGAIAILLLSGILIGYIIIVLHHVCSIFNEFNEQKKEPAIQNKKNNLTYSDEFFQILSKADEQPTEKIIVTEVVYID